ncbi:MAG: N-acetyltransferase [Candidatus Marinimicrobia bacterium]|nr:N-acetyltransferase [Candidatus Neomarinimicrobiota bacterium]
MEYKYRQEKDRFTLKYDSELLGEINYSYEGNDLNLLRVFVPHNHRGKGIADKITKWVLDFAQSNGLKIIPTCPYISHTFLIRNTDYKDIIVK